MGNTLYKFLDILKGNFVTFLCQFLEKLAKNYPKNMKLFWKNFEIIWRNYKIMILGIFWKFLGKYVHRVSFGKQILNYLLKTLKKCWQFVENFRGIVDGLHRSILNILWNLVKIFIKLLEKLRSKCWINFGKIMKKHRSNFILDTFVETIKKYWKYRCISICIDTENFSILTPLLAERTFATSLIQIMDCPRGALTADLKIPSLRLSSKSGHFSRH